MSSKPPFLARLPAPGSRTQADRDTEIYKARLEEARSSHAMMIETLSGGRSVERVYAQFGLTKNLIIVHLARLADIAAQLGGLKLDPQVNNHSVLIDVLSRKYTFDNIVDYYKITRAEMILCLADVAKEAVDAANSKGCKNEQLFRVLAYYDRGNGMSLSQAVARVKAEDGVEQSQGEKF